MSSDFSGRLSHPHSTACHPVPRHLYRHTNITVIVAVQFCHTNNERERESEKDRVREREREKERERERQQCATNKHNSYQLKSELSSKGPQLSTPAVQSQGSARSQGPWSRQSHQWCTDDCPAQQNQSVPEGSACWEAWTSHSCQECTSPRKPGIPHGHSHLQSILYIYIYICSCVCSLAHVCLLVACLLA